MKLSTSLLALLLVASNGFWLYREFDQGITQTYRSQERYENANRLVAASLIASEVVRERPKAEVSALLKRLFPTEPVFKKDGALHTIWLVLPVNSDGRVSQVAIDPGTQKQSAARNSATVGNEVFWLQK